MWGRVRSDPAQIEAGPLSYAVPPFPLGALQDAEALKGVFLTTSQFSSEALALAERRRIVLIDGRALTELMIEAGVGVSRVRSFTLSRIDEDYFGEDGDLA